jgi:hypothetical protein
MIAVNVDALKVYRNFRPAGVKVEEEHLKLPSASDPDAIKENY